MHDHVWVDIGDARGGRIDLGLAQRARRVYDLPLQIGLVDHVVVDEAQGANARGREVHEHGRAEAAAADAEHLGRLQLSLPPHANVV